MGLMVAAGSIWLRYEYERSERREMGAEEWFMHPEQIA